MELFILDSLLRRISVVDQFDSLIWTERYDTAGDFEMSISSNSVNRNKLSTGQTLAINQSNRVMKIESIEDKDTSEGRSLLTVKGPSLEAVTDERAARVSDATLVKNAKTGDYEWTIHDTPGNIARNIFQTICVNGNYSQLDIIPYMTNGTLYPADTIPEPTNVIDYVVDIKNSVYKALTDICQKYGLGFRISRNGDNSQLFFNVYTGTDRTTKQTTYPAVVFDPDFGNMSDVSAITSISGSKNTAYVLGPNNQTIVVYGNGGSESTSGFDRRVVTVDASSTDTTKFTGAALTAELTRLGKEELAKNRTLQALDGTVSQYSNFKYGVHYNLGDLVEERNQDGITNQMKVTEQIFASDEQGDRSYPTLSTDLFINPGSWFSSSGSHIWNDATGTWDTVS